MSQVATAVYAAGAVCWRVIDGRVHVLVVHRTVYGDVTIPKGGTKTVAIAAQQFTWHCGGSEESSVARPGTNLLEVVRKTTNDTVLWKCFKTLTLSPDVSW